MIGVLIVDDDFMVARVHAGFVTALDGFEVVGTAASGADALAAVDRLAPDLVLLDVYLPDMTGLDVLRRLRAAGSSVDVMVISAARDVDSIRSALHGGVLHYLVKPFDRRAFEERMRHYARVRADLDVLDQAAQADVDRVFAGARGTAAAPVATPKGIAPETLELVRTALGEAGADGLSASECSERTGLARVSARRYLEQLVAQGEADVRQRYGSAGRPERRFTLRSAR
ncbi:response regulator [Blastococcus saxobsidens]|uniref:Transcriptional regulatory protein n=1 Tax=Blastococcus saxobsidens (strain DD2) TaxID=1146883 RepID=H6RS46_BLASD|nr:response regulator [Blastococcus saxobsidens]CCG04240.1 Two component response regulator of citrate/malate metabolism with CheY-like receiver [Blastococcus saxobsidens DD2]